MSRKKMQIWILFYSLLFALGSFLAYHAWTQFQKSQDLLNRGERTVAEVVEYKTSRGKNGTVYAPIFKFKDRSQHVVSFTSTINSSPPAYDIGENVKIVYNRRNPQDVKVVSFWGLYRASIILLMVASPLLVIGGSYLLFISG